MINWYESSRRIVAFAIGLLTFQGLLPWLERPFGHNAAAVLTLLFVWLFAAFAAEPEKTLNRFHKGWFRK